MRKLFLANILIVITLLFCGCGNYRAAHDNADKASVVVDNINVDNYFVKGSNKQTFAKAPGRVVVVGENETETLLELGVENNILMAAAQNNRRHAMRSYNKEKFDHVKKCSSGYLNMEYITQLHPDLIIAQQCVFIRNRLKNTDYWNARGVATLVPLNTNTPSKHLVPETVEKEMKFIDDLGKAFRVEANAEKIISDTYAAIDEINEKRKNYKQPKVMVVEFLSSMICYDRTKLVGDMINRIGGKIEVNPPVIGFENVIKEDPDVLFVVCSHVDYGECLKKITQNPALRNLACIKNKRVYSIPLRFTYGSACRTEDGLRFLASKMYPGIEIDDKN